MRNGYENEIEFYDNIDDYSPRLTSKLQSFILHLSQNSFNLSVRYFYFVEKMQLYQEQAHCLLFNLIHVFSCFVLSMNYEVKNGTHQMR